MKIALVLGSGGARGFAHIGVIEELEARGHEVVSVSGTSMGALVGGLYAAGTLTDFRDWVRGLTSNDVLRMADVSMSSAGVIQGKRLTDKLHEFTGDIEIQDLPIPYMAVATDIQRRREVWFDDGPLLPAIRASISIPAFFAPVHLGGHWLVDGGLLNPLPIAPGLQIDADLTVGVSLFGRPGLAVPAVIQSDDAAAGAAFPGASSPAEAAGLTASKEGARSKGEHERQWEHERELDREGWSSEVAAVAEGSDERASERHIARDAQEKSAHEPSWAEFLSSPLRYLAGGASGVAAGAAATASAAAASAAARVGSVTGRARHSEQHSDSLGFFELMSTSLDVMQAQIEAGRSAMSMPEVMISVPTDTCQVTDFDQAARVIEVGRGLARDAFDHAGL